MSKASCSSQSGHRVLPQWTELLASKPDENYEDPADVAAIRAARDNMGDYKLKSALDYVVPDHLRMNAEKATVRLLVLKDLVSGGLREWELLTQTTRADSGFGREPHPTKRPTPNFQERFLVCCASFRDARITVVTTYDCQFCQRQFSFVSAPQIHQHKYEFNQQLLALRDKKIGIIEQIRGIITQLSHVQELLGPEHSLPLPELPKMHPDEIPEK